MSDEHPMQTIALDSHGTPRFEKNAIVNWLLDEGPFTLNDIALGRFSDKDRRQFAQLIGYSVSDGVTLSCGNVAKAGDLVFVVTGNDYFRVGDLFTVAKPLPYRDGPGVLVESPVDDDGLFIWAFRLALARDRRVAS